jgi:hypothetical protein
MIYTHEFEGVRARSGDILFTRDGTPGSLFGGLWGLLGRILPGDLDHVALYVGPGVRFIESAAKGVVVCEMPGPGWNAAACAGERLLLDELVGIADPLASRGLPPEDQNRIRESVVAYCLEQVAERKPYNVNFFDPGTDGAFYCSQLVYKAYLPQGINLHGRSEADELPFAQGIVFPEDIWNACHERNRIKYDPPSSD